MSELTEADLAAAAAVAAAMPPWTDAQLAELEQFVRSIPADDITRSKAS